MRRRTKIICGILLAVIIGGGALTVWQWNNIRAAISFTRFSQEELEDKLKEHDQKIKDVVDTVPDVGIRDITQEEKDALRDGTLTQEELIENLVKPQEEKPPAPQSKPEKPKPAQPPAEPTPEQPPELSAYEKEVATILAEVYVLREEFLIKLDNLQKEALQAYSAIPTEERTKKNLLALVGDYMDKGTDMEKECDAKIFQILTRLENLMKEKGEDYSLAQKVFDTYLEEKSLKKAWYMAELKKRGLT